MLEQYIRSKFFKSKSHLKVIFISFVLLLMIALVMQILAYSFYIKNTLVLEFCDIENHRSFD